MFYKWSSILIASVLHFMFPYDLSFPLIMIERMSYLYNLPKVLKLLLSKIYKTNEVFSRFGHCMYKCTLLLQPHLIGSKQNITEVSHPMYSCALALYSRKSKYHSYCTSFEYPFTTKMAIKAKSTAPDKFNTTTLLSHDIYNCT